MAQTKMDYATESFGADIPDIPIGLGFFPKYLFNSYL